ncbi:DUF4873 domain-containing protein [Pseudonocardia acaciae]|uniref:DUF4873 domain-containing protein n=1 Tax=Pseudonocardia acaciae TaxID=551276 RepID=UPI00048B5601|nr:DUF4873 domain-containing protein [Pseudonocardia acaciae]
MSEHEHDDEVGYSGPAQVLVGGETVTVRVQLRGFFQPIDGFFHWYGRIAANPDLDRLVSGNRADVVLRTPNGERPGELSDPDLWGRYRITGESTPPFALDLDIPEQVP